MTPPQKLQEGLIALTDVSKTYSFVPIGYVRSCYTQKFGIPRQPGLVTASEAHIELLPDYSQEAIVRGLDSFSHMWVSFVFHKTQDDGWRPTIRPPRLEGKKRLGVFATRSTHRPNPLGLSAVEIGKISRKLVESTSF